MTTTPTPPEAGPAPVAAPDKQPPGIASASVPDTLASLKVNPDTGLARAEVDLQQP